MKLDSYISAITKELTEALEQSDAPSWTAEIHKPYFCKNLNVKRLSPKMSADIKNALKRLGYDNITFSVEAAYVKFVITK